MAWSVHTGTKHSCQDILSLMLASRIFPAHHPQREGVLCEANHNLYPEEQPWVVLTSQWAITCQLFAIKTLHDTMKDRTKQQGGLLVTVSTQVSNQFHSSADSLETLCSVYLLNLALDRQLHFSSTNSLLMWLWLSLFEMSNRYLLSLHLSHLLLNLGLTEKLVQKQTL